MSHPSRACNYDLDIRDFQSKIRMDQLLKILLAIYHFQLKGARSIAIGHQSIVRSYHPGKKTEANNSLPVIVLQAFVIDEGNTLFNDCLQEFLVIWLFFPGVGKEQVGLIGNQFGWWNFLDTQ